MHIGFSGSRSIDDLQRIKIVNRLEQLKGKISIAITGACTGVDAAIALYVHEYMKDVRNMIVVPGIRTFVDNRVMNLEGALYFYMPNNSAYRLRNQKIVELASVVDIFFNGEYASGTWMTRNIANKAGKLGEVIDI